MKKEFNADPAPSYTPENRPEVDASDLTQRVLKNVFASAAQEEFLEDRCANRKLTWDTETPRAEAMSSEDIRRALDNGRDPWAEGIDGGPAKRLDNAPVRKLIVAAQICGLFQKMGTRLAEPGVVSVILIEDPADGLVIAEDIKSVLPTLSMLTKHAWETISVTVLIEEAPQNSGLAKFDFERIRCAISRGESVWILATTADAVPMMARALQPVDMDWPGISGDMVRSILRHTHSATNQIADEAIVRLLPSDDAIAALPLALIEHAFAADTALRVAERLAKVAETSRRMTADAADKSARPKLADLVLRPDLRRQAEQLLYDLQLWKEGAVDWSDVPSSLFLLGAPGNGKTAFPHALAGTADIPIVATSYTDCQQHGNMSEYLRAMARQVDKAISNAPSVFFIDELDSYITRHSNGHNASYLTSVVNGLLETLTRLNAAEGVIVIGAANRPDMIDPAILRAGRFDTHLHIGPPDLAGIRDILEKQFDGQISIPEGLAERLLGSPCADITALARAARAMARGANAPLDQSHLWAAAKDRTPAPSEAHLRRAAIHEAGHAVVGDALGLGQPSRLSVGGFGGEYAFAGEPPQTPDDVDRFLTVLLAGRAAEIAILGSPSAGAADDLRKATHLAFHSQFTWGLNDKTLISLHEDQFTLMTPTSPTGQKTNQKIQAAAEAATEIVSSHKPKIQRIADALIKHRELDAADLSRLLSAKHAH